MILRRHFTTLFLFLILLIIKVYGARLYNIPQIVVQPNGDTLQCFASGDEFHNWLHDKNNYTIIQDPITGYYVYAILQNDNLIPSQHIAGKIDPVIVNLVPGVNISVRQILEKRKSMFNSVPKGISSPDTGVINNIVVFIRFSDESEFTTSLTTYVNMFNSSTTNANSMYRYFLEVSYNKLSIVSTFYPTPPGTTVVSFQDSHPRGYFQPYNSVSNPIGYQGGDNGAQRTEREHTLLRNAVNSISSQVPTSLDIDGDDDGYVDNICFIIKGSPTGWASLLWPHMWALYSQSAYINSKRVWDYNFQLQTSTGVGVLCHEMAHSVGFPDLYHYTSDGMQPVDGWDIMENNANPPQHMGSYMKYRYTSWITNMPPITIGGTYVLKPLQSSTNNCYKILSPYSSSQFFVVEYRKREGTFESSLPGSGLLVYRINSDYDGQGNANGPPDEVYVYRPNGTLTANGSPSQAAFSSNSGRTMINDNTNPSSFLADGSQGGLFLWDVGSTDSTISFRVGTMGSNPYFYTNKTSINFSSVAVGGTKKDSALIVNGGGSDLRIYSVTSDNDQFIATPSSDTLSSLNSNKFYITFQPTSGGTKTGNIIFTHNASSSPDTVQVTGTAVAPFSLTPESIDFGTIFVGYISNRGVTVRNNTATSITVYSIISDNNQFTVTPASMTIPPSSFGLCQVSFRPTSVGVKNGNIIFTHSGTTSPDTLPLTGIAIPTYPIFAFSPTNISFGNVRLGMNKTDSILVTNTGNAVLHISSVLSDNSYFSVIPLTDSLQPSASRKYYITFLPTTETTQSGNIIFSHDANGSPDTVQLTGTGVFPQFSVVPLIIAFDTVYTSTNKLDSIEVTNTGGDTLTISSIVSDNAQFATTQSSAIIPPLNSQKINIIFNPNITGLHTGNIIIEHNAEGSPDTIQVFGTGMMDIIYYKRWNLVSVPLAIENVYKDSVFPHSIAGAYDYHNTAYSLHDTVTHGVGYWMKFASNQIITINGSAIIQDTIEIFRGWNLIGSINVPVPITTIASLGTTISTSIFGYQSGYSLSDTIYPGKGYWVRANGDGQLVLSSSYDVSIQRNIITNGNYLDKYNSISIGDAVNNVQTLYFGEIDNDIIKHQKLDLPPIPPNGIFDVRFKSQQLLETYKQPSQDRIEFPIAISSAVFPITIQWNIKNREDITYKIIAVSDGKLIENTLSEEQRKIQFEDNRITAITLVITSSTLVKEYCLFQNYPNPFNPRTTIKFGLPQTANVMIKIYNVLGEEITTLINQKLNSGIHTIDWNAGSYPSGVYYYKLQSDGYTNIKKLLLLK